MNTSASREGDFEAFYRRHFRHRVAQVRKAVGSHHDAEDIVQVSFIDLAVRWETAEQPEKLLSTIIYRQTCKHWRRQPSAKGIVETVLADEAEQVRARTPDPADVAEQRESIARIAKRITPVEREIVAARFHGDTAARIASAHEVRPNELRHAERWMRQRMAELIEPPQAGPIPLGLYAARLPTRQREVFELALAGVYIGQIAAHLRITQNCARVNLCHAKKAVNVMLHGPDHAGAAKAMNRQLRDARRERALWEFNCEMERRYGLPMQCNPGG